MATFYNQATLSYNGQSTQSNPVSGELLAVLSATKTAVPETYAADSVITYVVSLVNTGAAAFTGLRIADDLDAFSIGSGSATPLSYVDGSIRYYVNGRLQATPTVLAGIPLVFEGITVPAGGNAAIVYQARVNSFAPLNSDGSITNTVSVSGGGLSTPVTAEATITAAQAANLRITKSLSPATVAENEPLTYTFLIQNTGNEAAEGSVVLTDTFDPRLSDLTVTYNGAPLTPTTDYTYQPASGAFATLPGVISVPAATFTRDETTGVWSVTPGTATVQITGIV